MPIVTLLSDYGIIDGYVAEIKALLCHVLVPPQIVDITHQVPSFDIRHGAFQLWRTFSFFPAGTWHLALIEPAEANPVGGVYVRTRDYHFVGPDNGLLKWAVEAAEKREKQAARIFRLDRVNRLEAGYWGRDSYAAFLRDSLNGSRRRLAHVHRLQGSSFPVPHKNADGTLEVEVLTTDTFGNVITSLPLAGYAAGCATWKGATQKVSCYRDYLELPADGVGMIPGSNGLWEISARNASAAKITRLSSGDKVVWYP